ncbi:hydroxyacylglutathione hydrolase, cytoplasmic isozyme [Diutina rugosa]
MLQATVRRVVTRAMHIESIPMRWGSGDNYAYLLVDDKSKHAWLIDPAEPDEVVAYLDKAGTGYELKAIVNTHHHYDHSQGNQFFHKKYPDLPVIAGKDSPQVSYTPQDGEVIDLGDSLAITALHTPCHTQDSICYYVSDTNTKEKAVFTGDTLFISGCGRFFEGTPKEMDYSLNKVLAKLPDATKVYPGHEYTRSNIKFSQKVLDNDAIAALAEMAKANEHTTGKSTIGQEKQYNPFMMLGDPQVQRATGESAREAVMGKLREMKNNM